MDKLEITHKLFNEFRSYISLSFYDFYRYQLEDWFKLWCPFEHKKSHIVLVNSINFIISEWTKSNLIEQMTVCPSNNRLDKFEFCLWTEK